MGGHGLKGCGYFNCKGDKCRSRSNTGSHDSDPLFNTEGLKFIGSSFSFAGKVLLTLVSTSLKFLKNLYNNSAISSEIENKSIESVPLEDKSPLKVDLDDWLNSPQGHGNEDKFGFIHNGVKYMAKPERKETEDELPTENELVCNKIACVLDLEVPKFGKSNIDGNNSFIQEWFAINGKQLNHIYRYQPETVKYTINNINNIIKKHSANPKNDSLRFAKMLVFDLVIGNRDRHGRNIGMLEYNGKTLLSPIYDNYSSILPDKKYGTQFTFYTKIQCDDHLNPSVGDCLQEKKKIWTKDFYTLTNVVIERRLRIEKEISNSELRDDQKKALIKQLNIVVSEINSLEDK